MSKEKEYDVSDDHEEQDYEESEGNHEKKAHKNESKHKSKSTEHKKHSRRRESRHRSGVNPWMITSIALVLLLAMSIFTNGFRFGNNLDPVIRDVEKLASITGDLSVKGYLEIAAENLKEAQKSLVSESSKDPLKDDKDDPILNPVIAPTYSGDKAVIEMYVMSQCPYGIQVVDAIIPVKEKLGNALDLRIDYIFYPREMYQGQETIYCMDELCAMHGIDEIKGNIVQLCAMKYNPESYLKMIACQNQQITAIPGNWESCAQTTGLNVAKIKSCYEGSEGMELARQSGSRAEFADAQGSPTIFLNGNPYMGGRTEVDFLRAICSYLGSDAPLVCKDIPVCSADIDCFVYMSDGDNRVPVCNNPGTELAKCDFIDDPLVTATVFSSSSCASCDMSELIFILEDIFPNINIVEIDTETAEGLEVAEDYGFEKVPVITFSSNLVDTFRYKNDPNFRPAFEPIDDGYKLIDEITNPTYWVSEEKRMEYEEKLKEMFINDGRVVMYHFYGEGCPYCLKMDTFLTKLKDEFPTLEVIKFETYGSPENSALMRKFANVYGVQASGVPASFMHLDKFWGGYTESWDDEIRSYVQGCIDNGCMYLDLDKLE
jgi:thiol-disulfide isomerase/thioredoxin